MADDKSRTDCFGRSALTGALAALAIGFLARGGFEGSGLSVLIIVTFFGVWRYAWLRCAAASAQATKSAAPAAPPPPSPPQPSPAMVQAALAAPVAPAAAAPEKPALLDAPRGGVGDDLKLIKGIGDKLEAMLHRMGVHHFDQIAHWTAAEVAWVDQNLEGFKGRVTRDGWVAQARILAAGGTTPHAERVAAETAAARPTIN